MILLAPSGQLNAITAASTSFCAQSFLAHVATQYAGIVSIIGSANLKVINALFAGLDSRIPNHSRPTLR